MVLYDVYDLLENIGNNPFEVGNSALGISSSCWTCPRPQFDRYSRLLLLPTIRENQAIRTSIQFDNTGNGKLITVQKQVSASFCAATSFSSLIKDRPSLLPLSLPLKRNTKAPRRTNTHANLNIFNAQTANQFTCWKFNRATTNGSTRSI